MAMAGIFAGFRCEVHVVCAAELPLGPGVDKEVGGCCGLGGTTMQHGPYDGCMNSMLCACYYTCCWTPVKLLHGKVL